ncbi:EAL domain-containing protein [Alteromonas sp. a30]|uniref:EAL domain-containing protein n=1 Tax=Alteromonas sp. a30 TaxID=2730917 RepID=UPI00227E9394|nr:EAL domain-containing protein [Alteromonas sp. a30]MCY7296712.1 EAL domain-containing protein [Alteromonas sp. a30]
MYCADCEKLENYFFDNTTFWLFLPTLDSVGKALTYCQSSNYPVTKQSSHCLSVEVSRAQIQHFLLGIYGEFEPPEVANTKVTTTAGAAPNLEDMGRMVSAEVLVNRFNSAWMIDSITEHRYETHFQPIFTLDDQGQHHAYGQEGLFRIRDNNNVIVPPGLAFQLAEHSDLLFSLDLAARRSAVSHYAMAKLNGKLFINFNPSSIYDPSYCLRATASAISALGIPPSNVVFEITETHNVTNESVMKGILNFYRNAGFGVALDDIGSGWSGLNMLHKLRPDYVKIDMELVRNIHIDSYKQAIVKHLVQIAHANGAKVVAEGIETEDELAVLKQYKPDYYQGYYFAKPSFFEAQCTVQEQQRIKAILTGVQ